MLHGRWGAVAVGLALALASPSRADDAADAKALLDKAIAANGGETELAKLKASSSKLKGTIHTMGMALEFTGDVTTQGGDKERVDISLDIMGMAFKFVQILNGDKGWNQINGQTTELDADKLAEAREQAHGDWIATLLPLKDKAYKLSTLGEVKVEDKPAVGLKVSREGKRDVSLFFDAKTFLLVKTEERVKDDNGQEVSEETFLTAHAEKGAKQAMKLSVKRDGKIFMEAEVTEFKIDPTIDDATFAKP